MQWGQVEKESKQNREAGKENQGHLCRGRGVRQSHQELRREQSLRAEYLELEIA